MKVVKKIKDTFTLTGGTVYSKKTVSHLRGHVSEENWKEFSRLMTSDEAKKVYGFTERNGKIIYYSFDDKP